MDTKWTPLANGALRGRRAPFVFPPRENSPTSFEEPPLPIPPLCSHGLLPPGIHDCTLQEIQDRYVTSFNGDCRKKLWDNLQILLKEVRSLGYVDTVLIDGGFTSDKQITKDVDVALVMPPASRVSSDPDLQSRVFAFILGFWRWHDDIEARLAIDVYPNLEWGNDFGLFFQYVKAEEASRRGISPDDLKGVLRARI